MEEEVATVRHRHRHRSLDPHPVRAAVRQPGPRTWRHRRRVRMAQAPLGRRTDRRGHWFCGVAVGRAMDQEHDV